jgi:hypothetical protein
LNQTKTILYYLILSTVAALLLIILTFNNATNVNTTSAYDKLIVGGVFIISCILGVSLALHPGCLKRIVKQTNHETRRYSTQKKSTRKRHGHHPNCDQFQKHTVQIKNKTRCAGCLGLSLGCILSMLLMIGYVFTDNKLPSHLPYFLVFFGFILVGLVYVEIIIPIRHAIVHVISSGFLVIGFLFITISILEITGNKIYGILSVLLSFLWLDTRIQLSNWRHTLICNNCKETCKMY